MESKFKEIELQKKARQLEKARQEKERLQFISEFKMDNFIATRMLSNQNGRAHEEDLRTAEETELRERCLELGEKYQLKLESLYRMNVTATTMMLSSQNGRVSQEYPSFSLKMNKTEHLHSKNQFK